MRFKILAATILLTAFAGSAATVTVNQTKTYQTIDGFGGFGGMNVWWSGGPFFNDAFLNLLIDTLGVTIVRTELYPTPDQTASYTQQIPFFKALIAKANASHEPLKIIGTIWTPPSSMKSNGSTTGGSLNPASRDAYGDYVVAYCQRFKTDMGVDLYAVSPQNEPALATGYNSCQLDPQPFGLMAIAVAKKMAAAKIPVKMHYPDNIWWPDWAGQAIQNTVVDPVADSVGSILSVHYCAADDATNLTEMKLMYNVAHDLPTPWNSYYRPASSRGKVMPLWNTEFGGDADTWAGGGDAWQYAKNMYMCLKVGQFSAVVYWIIAPHTNPDQANESLMPSRHMGPKAYVAKSYYRYIRPGAVMVDATSSDASIWCMAFKHAAQQTVTVVMLNTGSAEQTVTVAGAGLPAQFTEYQTSPTQNCANKGVVAPGAAITLPVKSITTLYNPPTSSIAKPAATAIPTIAQRASAVLFAIDGRMIAGRATGPGVYCAVRTTAGCSFVKRTVDGR